MLLCSLQRVLLLRPLGQGWPKGHCAVLGLGHVCRNSWPTEGSVTELNACRRLVIFRLQWRHGAGVGGSTIGYTLTQHAQRKSVVFVEKNFISDYLKAGFAFAAFISFCVCIYRVDSRLHSDLQKHIFVYWNPVILDPSHSGLLASHKLDFIIATEPSYLWPMPSVFFYLQLTKLKKDGQHLFEWFIRFQTAPLHTTLLQCVVSHKSIRP